jgi:hypothetical protein
MLRLPINDTAERNSSVGVGATLGAATEDRTASKGVFLLVLNHGTSNAATDYWVADDYLEYISPDSTRSHIPLEALDLQNTVTQNAPVAFRLSSAPRADRIVSAAPNLRNDETPFDNLIWPHISVVPSTYRSV